MEVIYVPNIHNLDEWRLQENEIVEYFIEKLKKNEDIVIFFEAILGDIFSYVFEKNPDYIIENYNDKEYINDLQFKYKLFTIWKTLCLQSNSIGKLKFIAVPFLEDYKPFLKKIYDFKEKHNFNTLTEVLYILRDLENNHFSNDSVLIKNNNKNYHNLVEDLNKNILSKGSPIMETREFLTIKSITKYKERNPKNNEKYFLVFGKSHNFLQWNKIQKKIKFKEWKNKYYMETDQNPMENVVRDLI